MLAVASGNEFQSFIVRGSTTASYAAAVVEPGAHDAR